MPTRFENKAMLLAICATAAWQRVERAKCEIDRRVAIDQWFDASDEWLAVWDEIKKRLDNAV